MLRFGVEQKGRVRPCDDALRSLHNAICGMLETLDIRVEADFGLRVARAFAHALDVDRVAVAPPCPRWLDALATSRQINLRFQGGLQEQQALALKHAAWGPGSRGSRTPPGPGSRACEAQANYWIISSWIGLRRVTTAC